MNRKEFTFLNRISTVDSLDKLFLTFESIWEEVIYVDFLLTKSRVRIKKNYREVLNEDLDVNFAQIENIFLKENMIFVNDFRSFFKNFNYSKDKFDSDCYVIFPVIINKSLRNLVILKAKYSKECFLLAGNIISNFTEKISLQNLVERSRKYFDTIFNQINSKIVIVDKNFNILFSNSQKENVYKCYELLFGIDRPCMFCFREDKTFTININKKHFEIQHILIDNSMVCIVKDITNFIKMKEELIKSQQLSLLGKLASEITHEIKNPLNSIKLKLEILKRKFKIDREVKEIEKEIERLSQITGEYLQLGKAFTLNRENFNLKDLISRIYENYKEILEKKRIKFIVNCNENLNINGDKDKLYQVFVNLINNSIEASCSEIVIECKMKESKILIFIKDNGTGIKNPEKIFSPFYSEKEQGSGLGLIIAKRIVEAHRGKIEYLGKEKGYTLFKIVLPVD